MLTIQLLIQFATLFLILKFYMRRDHIIKVIATYLLPVIIYILGLVFVVPIQQSLLKARFSKLDLCWSILSTDKYIFVLGLLIVLFALSIKLETELFGGLSNTIKLLDKLVLWLEGVTNVAMLIYGVVFFVILRSNCNRMQFSLFLYCVITLAMQLAMKFICILFAGFEGEKRGREDIETAIMDLNWCRRQVLHYLASSYRLYGIIFTVCGAYPLVVSIEIVRTATADSLLVGLIFMVLSLAALGTGIRCLFFSIFPKSMNSWKRIKSWGHEEKILRMLCRELFDEKKPITKRTVYGYTQHFLISPIHFFRKIYYLPLVDGIMQKNGKTIYIFKDGGALKLSNGMQGAESAFTELNQLCQRS